jgi:hypothetical protein
MTEKTYKTRGGNAAFLLGHGPLSKTFLEFEVAEQRYLVFATDLRYRMDFDDDTKEPKLTPMDILEHE